MSPVSTTSPVSPPPPPSPKIGSCWTTNGPRIWERLGFRHEAKRLWLRHVFKMGVYLNAADVVLSNRRFLTNHGAIVHSFNQDRESCPLAYFWSCCWLPFCHFSYLLCNLSNFKCLCICMLPFYGWTVASRGFKLWVSVLQNLGKFLTYCTLALKAVLRPPKTAIKCILWCWARQCCHQPASKR